MSHYSRSVRLQQVLQKLRDALHCGDAHRSNIENQTGITSVVFACNNFDLVDRLRAAQLPVMLEKKVSRA